MLSPSLSAAAVPVKARDQAEKASGIKTEDYQISPGDILRIGVWKEPELTTEVFVRLDGRITVPLLGDTDAAGRSPNQLAAEVQAKLARFLELPPQVTVTVSQAVSARFFVVGDGRVIRAVGVEILKIGFAVGVGVARRVADGGVASFDRVGDSVIVRVAVEIVGDAVFDGISLGQGKAVRGHAAERIAARVENGAAFEIVDLEVQLAGLAQRQLRVVKHVCHRPLNPAGSVARGAYKVK